MLMNVWVRGAAGPSPPMRLGPARLSGASLQHFPTAPAAHSCDSLRAPTSAPTSLSPSSSPVRSSRRPLALLPRRADLQCLVALQFRAARWNPVPSYRLPPEGSPKTVTALPAPLRAPDDAANGSLGYSGNRTGEQGTRMHPVRRESASTAQQAQRPAALKNRAHSAPMVHAGAGAGGPRDDGYAQDSLDAPAEDEEIADDPFFQRYNFPTPTSQPPLSAGLPSIAPHEPSSPESNSDTELGPLSSALNTRLPGVAEEAGLPSPRSPLIPFGVRSPPEVGPRFVARGLTGAWL